MKTTFFTCIFILLTGSALFSHPAFSEDSPINLNAWSKYASSLKNCTPGKFVLPDMTKASMLQKVLKTFGNIKNPTVAQQNKIKKADVALQHANINYTIAGWAGDNTC